MYPNESIARGRWFLEKMDFHNRRMENILSKYQEEGRLTPRSMEIFSQFVDKTWMKPRIYMHEYMPLFLHMGIRPYDNKDAIALIRHFKGQYGYLAFSYLFKHTALVFKWYHEVFCILSYLDMMDSKDVFHLLVSKKEKPRTQDFVYLGSEGDRDVYESDNFIYKVGKQLGTEDQNFRECNLFVETVDPLLNPVEMFYPSKNVLLYGKVSPVNSREELLLGLKKQKENGWKQREGWDLSKTSLSDWGLLDGKSVLKNYSQFGV